MTDLHHEAGTGAVTAETTPPGRDAPAVRRPSGGGSPAHRAADAVGRNGAPALSRRARVLTAVALALLAGWALLNTAKIVFWSYAPIPFWDGFVAVLTERSRRAGELTLSELFSQHNEHRIMVPRLEFVAEYALFGGRLVFLLTTIALSCVLLALILAYPITTVWRDRLVAFGFAAFALVAVLTPAGYENLTWAFQIGFVQAYLFAAVAFALAVYAWRPTMSPAFEVGVTFFVIVAASAATFSVAQGLATWPVLVGTLLLRGVRRRIPIAVGIAGAVITAAYLRGLEPVEGHPRPSEALHHPLGIARYAVTYLGHPAGAFGRNVAAAAGVLGIALLLVLLIAVVRRRSSPTHATMLFGAAAASFVVMTAFQTALGRLGFGIPQALSSRYAIGAAMFWVALATGFAPLIARRFELRVLKPGGAVEATGLVYVGACLVVAFAASIANAKPKAQFVEARTAKEVAVASFASGVRDDDALKRLHPIPDIVVDNLRWLQRERLGPWASPYGSVLAQARLGTSPPGRLGRCLGSIDATRPVVGGKRFDGWIVAPESRGTARHVRVVDERGTSHGIGVVGVPRPDVAAAGITSSSYRGFVAYARAQADVPLSLVLVTGDGRPACALSIP